MANNIIINNLTNLIIINNNKLVINFNRLLNIGNKTTDFIRINIINNKTAINNNMASSKITKNLLDKINNNNTLKIKDLNNSKIPNLMERSKTFHWTKDSK